MDSENNQSKKILSLRAKEDFVGREVESNAVLRYAESETSDRGLLIPAEPGAGLSEFLRQSYDKLFTEKGIAVPVFFAFSQKDKSAEDCARRFLRDFLTQIIAFRLDYEGLLKIAPDISELTELAARADWHWVKKLIDSCEAENLPGDKISFVRQAFSAPLRALENGIRTIILFDDFHYVGEFKNRINLLEELKDIFLRTSAPFVFGGRRRFVLNAVQTGGTRFRDFEVIHINGLCENEASLYISRLSEKMNVAVSEQTKDLLIRKFDCKPFFTEAVFAKAAAQKSGLEDFYSVEKNYADALFNGGIGKYYDTLFDEITPDSEIQKEIANLAAGGEETISTEFWRSKLNLGEKDFSRLTARLNIHEIINAGFGSIRIPRGNDVLSDYLSARYSLAVEGEQRALVIANTLSNALKRAPELMKRHHRRLAAIGLRSLMEAFNSRKVPEILFDYEEFKRKYNDEPESDVWNFLQEETAALSLPKVVYTANCAAIYPPIRRVSDDERAAVALGFEHGNYTKKNEIVWIAAEVDSKLEAPPEVTEFWCDRLEAIALICNFPKYQLWLITPEGFSAESCEVLRQRGVYGSSRLQAEMLFGYLKTEISASAKISSTDYEMILPIDGSAELIAAQTVEEIVFRRLPDTKSINQIKTALVEAFINVAENSYGLDRKIYLKVSIEDEKITITVSNRSIKLSDEVFSENESEICGNEGRRAWGLKLIRSLTDKAIFQQADGGTLISMTKYLKKTG